LTRRLRRFLGALAAASLAVLGSPATAAAQPASRPNIVYILADDLGWKDVGYHGSDIRTPNIDALAKGGARLEQFYAQPFCTPSRAALMTGRYPFRYGLQTVVILSNGKYGLPTDEWTLPQALKAAGYRTAIVGKWHLGHADRKYWPKQRGFDEQYGPLLGEIDYFTHSAHGTKDWFREEKPLDEKGYATELIGREAVRVIDKQDPKKPLFLYLAFTSPHAPYQAPEKYLTQYASIPDPNRRAYAAMVTAMDDQIGDVLKALDRRGMRENTLIVFGGDNGGPRDAQFTGEADTSKGTIPADNGPYRDGKGSNYEGGTRVVTLANWSGHIPAGTVVDQPIHMVDMLPTLAALAGAKAQGGKPLDGVNVWPAIAEGKPSPRTDVVYGLEPFRVAVRKGDWKLVWKTTLPSKVELFDVAHDPSEKTNLADEEPQKVAELKEWAETLSRDAAPPLFLLESIGSVKAVGMSDVALPEDAKLIEQEP
jgi:arylsulfatase A-like enzyme